MTSVACVGETMGVITPDTPEPLAGAARFTLTAGGAESNVAIGLARRGVHAMWLSRVGDDAVGDRILSELDAAGVDTSWVIRDHDAPTGVYLKDPRPVDRAAVSYYRSGSAASRMSVIDLARWPMREVDWVHVSGITAALSASCDHLLERIIDDAAAGGYGVSLDINYRPALWPPQRAALRCLALGASCDVVLVGLDEAQVLWAVRTAEDVAALFPHARSVVVKAGADEAVEFVTDPDGRRVVHRVPALPVDVIEPVGAGDAFAAGFLDGYLRGRPSAERLAAGHAAAALALTSLTDGQEATR